MKVTVMHWLTMTLGIAAVAFAALYFSEAEAVETQTVGSISVQQFIPNEGVGVESLRLSFSGILSKPSTANLEGWTLSNESGVVMDLSDVILTNEGSVKLCEAGATDESCDYFFTGADMFNDDAGELHIIARNGVTSVFITYEGATAGQTFGDGGLYTDDVYTPGDKIEICEVQNNGTMRMRAVNITPLTNDIEGDIAAGLNIVPPFVYEVKKTLQYHPGINWPAGEATLAAGCQ